MKKKLGKSLLLALGFFIVGTADATPTLIGDLVDLEITGDFAVSAVDILVSNDIEIGAGFDVNPDDFFFGEEFIDIQESVFVMEFEESLGENAFLTFSNLDFGTGIVDILFSTSNTDLVLSSFTPSSFTIDATAFAINSPGDPASIRVELFSFVLLPVPGTLALLGLGCMAAGIARRREKG